MKRDRGRFGKLFSFHIWLSVLAVSGLLQLMTPAGSAQADPPRPGMWTLTGSMSTARAQQTATLLPNGDVLVAGGRPANGAPLATAELYNQTPTPGSFSSTGSMTAAREAHTATLLPNGNVLVAGGATLPTAQPTATAELYDPSTGSWSATGSMGTARDSHAATLLPNGKVLVAGGETPTGITATAELYDPATGSWTPTGPMGTARVEYTAVLLPSGKVLVAGGFTPAGVCCITATAELYDPSTGSWSATGSMGTTRYAHAASLLATGKVLVAGGVSLMEPAACGPGPGGLTNGSELYDPLTGSWTSTGSMVGCRAFFPATLLPSGKVLVEGGVTTAGAELYDPSTASWSQTGTMSTARFGHTATLLAVPAVGRVLVTGGENDITLPVATAEFYKASQP